ncbi:MAG: polyribonucleotide nucleotidyltransferase [Acidobacteriia bacterium]|nr:polyribonucleotide nucleotidyltransferase [Terriglobia bacterium]
MAYSASTEIGGRNLSIETGRWAKQAQGSAVVRYGDTVVIVTACASQEPREGIDFFPLTVDYREYNYAAGKIPGGYIKREGRPSEKETLTSRLIDRPIRPLFPEGFRCETQVIALVLSADPDNDPDIMSITGASTALLLSEIPFYKPIAAVRVGLLNDRLVINPNYADQKSSLLNLTVVGSEEGIVMVESGARELSEEKMIEALEFGHNEIKKIVGLQKSLAAQMKVTKRPVEPVQYDQALFAELKSKFETELRDALDTSKHPKIESQELVRKMEEKILQSVPEEDEARRTEAGRLFEHWLELIFREDVVNARRRPDHREFDQIRPITCEVGVLPRTHGSAIFTRGETQALVTTTLGTAEDVQRVDILMEAEGIEKRFMLHYNFPPFSVGEVGRMGAPGRREIGHGALAERSIKVMLPEEDKFPYTVRVVSDILESNGSSSMATVCGSTLALMDAGVPIKAPVAGIAMGLVKEGEKYAILTDIAGAEDHFGDMDFKVAGTASGITALQMDIKIDGVTPQIMSEALTQAKRARLQILETMKQAIAEPRSEISSWAPRIFTLQIKTDKIRDVIGPGGKVIRSIIEQTGVKINVNDDGKIDIAATDEEGAQKAIRIIRDLTAEAEVGKTYVGRVSRIADFGAFVEIIPGTDGLLHISEIDEQRIRDVRDVLKEGDTVMVKVIGVEGNKIKLSRKAVLREQRQKGGPPHGGHGPAGKQQD